MSARLTVVLDDEELYRRLKVRAAEEGVPMKDLVEAGLRHVLGLAEREKAEPKHFDWDRYEALMAEFRKEDEALGETADYPTDLSDVKHYLYGYPRAAERHTLRVAEERSEYEHR
jgi:hypothetical protein